MVMGELLSAYLDLLHTLDLALVLLVYKLMPLLTAVTLTLMLKADAKVFADLMHLITC